MRDGREIAAVGDLVGLWRRGRASRGRLGVERNLVFRFRHFVANGLQALEIGGDRIGVIVRHLVVEANGHRRAERRAFARYAFTDGAHDLVARPGTDAGIDVGRQVFGIGETEHRAVEFLAAGECQIGLRLKLGVFRRVAVAAGQRAGDEIFAARDLRVLRRRRRNGEQRNASNESQQPISSHDKSPSAPQH